MYANKKIMYKFIDAHTHLQFSAYDSDRNDVISRIRKEGIIIINIGTQRVTSEEAIKLAKENSDMYATVGLHPIHTAPTFHDSNETQEKIHENGEVFNYEYYKKLALEKRVLGIGECGLDYFHLPENITDAKERQKSVFIEQMKLSRDVEKPLMIHCRNAFPDLIKIIKENNSSLYTDNPGIIHFFSGTIEEATELLAMGFSFTFGGAITYPQKKNSTNYEEIIKMMPIEKILSETDAPYVAPVPYRGKRNEPAYVIEVVKKLAILKQVSLETMSVQILKNADRVFGIEL